MAEIQIKDLVLLLKERSISENDVPPEQALYIRFTADHVEGVESKAFEIKGGGNLVIDLKGGKVVGVEIA